MQVRTGKQTKRFGTRNGPVDLDHIGQAVVREPRPKSLQDEWLRVAGEMLPLRAGDIAFIPPGPEYPHQIINTSAAPLKYLSISTRETPEICEYPDSSKYLATAATDEGKRFDALQRSGTNLDYWDGEP